MKMINNYKIGKNGKKIHPLDPFLFFVYSQKLKTWIQGLFWKREQKPLVVGYSILWNMSVALGSQVLNIFNQFIKLEK